MRTRIQSENLLRSNRSSISSIPSIEPLESRRLMSAGPTGWFTDDTYQLVPGQAAVNLALARDPTVGSATSGNLYAVGHAWTGSNWTGIVREKTPSSQTWQPLFQYALNSNYSTLFWAAAVGQDGTLYVAGKGNDANGQHWIVLSAKPGGSLQLIDDFQLSPGYQAWARGMTIDAKGDIFVAGQAFYQPKRNSLQNDFVVRELPAGGTSFRTVLNSFSGIAWGITSIASGADAGIYAVGLSNSTWEVVKSADAGASWNVIDQSFSGTARAAGGDNNGNLFVVGTASNQWVVRESSDGGATWTTVDDFQLSSGASSTATAVGVDGNGNVDVVGASGNDAIVRNNAGGSWQVVDDVPSAEWNSFITDESGASFAGGGGNNYWLMRDPPASAHTIASIHRGHSHHRPRHRG